MQNKEPVCLKTSDDLGYGDEIKDEPVTGISAESFYSKPNAKKRPKCSVIAIATATDLDPKITLLQEVKVKLERLPLKEAMDGFSRIKVSPPRKRRGSGLRDGNGGWFAKRARKDKTGSNLDLYFGNPKLIRPPILNVESKAADSAAAQPFLPQPSKRSSSYLFGGGDDDDEFERVPDDEVIVTDTDDEEEEEETEDDDDIEVIEVKKQQSEKEGFEASAAISPTDIKREDDRKDEIRVIKEAPAIIQKPVPDAVEPVADATIPLLMRLKKEANAASTDPAKIRFPAPASSGNRNMIECKWTDCQMSFTTYGKLSDHLRVSQKEHMHT